MDKVEYNKIAFTCPHNLLAVSKCSELVLVALSGFWSVFPTWQVADVVVFSVPPGRHHYHIIWRVCLIMGKLPDDIAVACKHLVVLSDLP